MRPFVLFLMKNVNWQFTILTIAIIFHLVDLSSTTVLKDHHKALSLASPLQNRLISLSVLLFYFLKTVTLILFSSESSPVYGSHTHTHIYCTQVALQCIYVKRSGKAYSPPHIILVYLYLCVMPKINKALRGCSQMRVTLHSNLRASVFSSPSSLWLSSLWCILPASWLH